MNPDIIFTEPVIKKLAERMENDSNIGAISPALVGSDGNFQRGYFQRYPGIRQFVYYYSILAKFFDGSPKLKNRFLENHEIDITTGKLYFTEQLPFAFFMTTKSVLENIGVLDENFFLFFEDVDLSYRINKKYSLAVDTSVRVTHLGGESFKTEDNWWLYGRLIKSQIYFFEKHYSGMKTLTIKLLAKLNSLAILSFEKIRNPWKKKKQYRQLNHSHFLKLMKED
jgi:GT2 family glycosyltransferase